MAAPSSVRVRLVFDYPPPAIPESSMFWLLVDVKRCRVVTDLSSIIRERFFYGQRGGLSLYVEDCLLPPGENIQVIRDNDCIRVTWEEIYPDDETLQSPKKSRKRHRKKQEDEEDHEDLPEIKIKKQKRDSSSQQDVPSVSDHNEKPKKKKKKRESGSSSVDSFVQNNEKPKKKVEAEDIKAKDKKSRVSEEQTTGTKQRKSLPVTSHKANSDLKGKGTKKSKSSSSDLSGISSSDSDETQAVQKKNLKSSPALSKKNKPAASIPVKKTLPPSTSNVTVSGKNKKKATSSSSSDSDSSEEESTKVAKSSNVAAAKPQSVKAASAQSQKKKQPEGSECDSLVTSLAALPNENGEPLASNRFQGPSPDGRAWGRGIGRGRGRGDEATWRGRGFRGGRGDIRNIGRGRGDNNNFVFNYNAETQKRQQLNESITNCSVVIQNPPEIPKKDYSSHPLLAAPPQIGKVIAFKLLELTENYTPEVSDYKEGRIISYDPLTQQLEVEILSRQSASKEPGKFDLVYQLADGRDLVEYAVTQDRKITQSWSSLIEPRLILDTSSEQTIPAEQTATAT